MAGFKDEPAALFDFGSRNAEAHLTIMEFYMDEADSPKLIFYMDGFDDIEAVFDRFDTFPAQVGKANGTIYLATSPGKEI
ncbi:hypothetical protein [Flavobacterium selenitireducens]|uniref:hypothetical protein n=1 Tax=Flavobacterium selenitireducens TaxID=2722704 RepID=UPI00168B5281|nr:hypothetical protein [Flavobacterium selenitireducens]MBD3583093.1 hypothetical protein [Flavobacterium selenitireducens]